MVDGVAPDRERPAGEAEATGWEGLVAALWARLDELEPAAFVAQMEPLAAAAPSGTGNGPFELASAFDSTGHPDRAVPLYREALARGLTGLRRRRAVIQMASSLRNLGQADESVRLLRAERAVPAAALDPDEAALADAVVATLALALADLGHEREALSLTLTALATHLPRYQRSMTAYAAALTDPGPART